MVSSSVLFYFYLIYSTDFTPSNSHSHGWMEKTSVRPDGINCCSLPSFLLPHYLTWLSSSGALIWLVVDFFSSGMNDGLIIQYWHFLWASLLIHVGLLVKLGIWSETKWLLSSLMLLIIETSEVLVQELYILPEYVVKVYAVIQQLLSIYDMYLVDEYNHYFQSTTQIWLPYPYRWL